MLVDVAFPEKIENKNETENWTTNTAAIPKRILHANIGDDLIST